MLDLPSVTPVADRDRRRHIELLARQFLAARARGDAADIVARLASDFTYRARGAWPMWPYHAGPIERSYFAEALARINAEFEVLGADIHEFLIDGESTAMHATFATRNRGAGAPTEFDLWMYLRFRDDLIVEAAVYVDVARAARLLPVGLVEVLPRDRGREGGGPGANSSSRASDRFGSADGTAPGETGLAEGEAPEVRSRMWMERVARDFFALRAKGDFAGMLARLAPDFIYDPQGDWTKPPLVPDHCDRAAFAESLRLVNVEFEDLGGEVHELLVDGDLVVAHRTIRLRNRGAGDIAHVDEWVCFRVREGLDRGTGVLCRQRQGGGRRVARLHACLADGSLRTDLFGRLFPSRF